MIFDINKKGGSAFIDESKGSISYADLSFELTRFRNLQCPRGLVFCLCSNEIGAIFGYLSSLDNSMPVALLDGSKAKENLSPLFDLYKPNYIWTKKGYFEDCYEVLYEYADYVLIRYSDFKHKLNQDLALLLTTSGSTGSPKLVRLSVKNILSNAESIAEYLKIDSGERPIMSLPIYYSYGLSVVNSHLIKGSTILLTCKSVLQKDFWTFMRDNRATSISGVPYTYEMLRRLRFSSMDLPFLKTMTQAGGKLNPVIVKEFIEDSQIKGRKFIVMYGQTEATARMSYTPSEKALEKAASIGIAIPGGKFRLIDNDGHDITTEGTDGELVYEGDNVSMGYAEAPEDLSKGNENNGILFTGDIARFDGDGYYYITGRKKRFVKIWGNRCNLDAIEQLVKELTLNCACVGVDDLITVFVEVYNLDKEIPDFLSKKTGLNVRAFKVRHIVEIPKSASGKVQYSELQKLL